MAKTRIPISGYPEYHPGMDMDLGADEEVVEEAETLPDPNLTPSEVPYVEMEQPTADELARLSCLINDDDPDGDE